MYHLIRCHISTNYLFNYLIYLSLSYHHKTKGDDVPPDPRLLHGAIHIDWDVVAHVITELRKRGFAYVVAPYMR